MNEKGYDSSQIDDLVNHKSGLLGVSEISSDMKTLLEKEDTDPRARQAIEMFCYQLRKYIGAFAAVLGGLDTLVFTGGIGERAAPVRWRTCQDLAHLGIHIDAGKNRTHAQVISTPDSSCTVRIIPTKEDLMIARYTRRIVFGM
jgi:acetate kinase